MRVLLAGYNIDTEVIKDFPPRPDATPETLSASYARISRDPRPIDELRRSAREEVEKARKSNKAIIFKMGHHSVAEHAVFNFDIVGVSRLAIEEIEHYRLCSYTEKSQRYITLGDDFIIPGEIKNSRYRDDFVDIIRIQNTLYHKLHKMLFSHILKKYQDLANDPKQQIILDGWAKEDARYITSLATMGQLGATINARNLELMLRRFAGHRLSEVREVGEKLWGLVENVAPSIILFYKANDYDQKTYPELKKVVEGIRGPEKAKRAGNVDLVGYTKDADNIITASIIHTSTLLPFRECVKGFSNKKKKELIKTAFKYMEFYDCVLREFEYVNLTYDMIVSASCFAQLKRHRIATMTCQEYNPELGVTIPESISEIGMEKEFTDVIKKTEALYHKIKKDMPDAAPYILTNSHRRRVLFSCNARELYHISRLREDEHAQWDIRDITGKMTKLAKDVMPLVMLLIGGKDRYPSIYKEVYSL